MCNDVLRKNTDEQFKGYYPSENLSEKPNDNNFDINNSFKKIFKNSEIENDLISTDENSEHLYTGKKRNPENQNIIDNSNNNTEKIAKNKKQKNKERGRKKKKSVGGTKHTKLDEDNIIRKIKTKVNKFILDDLNKSIKYSKFKFLPLTPKMNVKLTKEVNIEFLNRTIADIFGNTELNKRYNKKGLDNKKIIEKIFKENKETETIKILSMTFKEVLDDIRENKLEKFLKSIQDKEEKNEKMNESEEEMKENIDEVFSIESFMNKVKKLLFNYENWFIQKIGRNYKNKNKSD
jgi:hypothetical protein